ncbi:MAG TPA: Holliday junction branch migration DNA helicase RuvB [Candidatus Dojkabacteria bacterium]|nr:Holliday junction branch migration DNA helicase RuvB [Candidatus Dojkabacteria bacterium]HQF36091.1 Holliday junction branch migration DNA helicase RuvB [Candidatus Dojkabacteria bacterium]
MSKNADVKNVNVSRMDSDGDIKIRPDSLDSLIGRKREKKIIKMAINGAKKRNEPLDHILFYGPPGLGKTTFAFVVAKELGVTVKITSGPAIERQGDLAAIVSNLKEGDILFIDEIHRLNKNVEEILYPAMEDFALDIVVGKGVGAKSMRLSLPPFTLIGATTRLSLLSPPLRDRFGILLHLDFFNIDDLVSIILRASGVLGVNIDEQAAVEIAKRSRGTGRVAVRLLRRVRDMMDDVASKVITKQVALKALDTLGIDEFGLDDLDRKILQIMINSFDGGPVGLSTLASAVAEDKSTLSDVVEPFLIKAGLIQRTHRGRVVTDLGYKHLGLNAQHRHNEGLNFN